MRTLALCALLCGILTPAAAATDLLADDSIVGPSGVLLRVSEASSLVVEATLTPGAEPALVAIGVYDSTWNFHGSLTGYAADGDIEFTAEPGLTLVAVQSYPISGRITLGAQDQCSSSCFVLVWGAGDVETIAYRVTGASSTGHLERVGHGFPTYLDDGRQDGTRAELGTARGSMTVSLDHTTTITATGSLVGHVGRPATAAREEVVVEHASGSYPCPCSFTSLGSSRLPAGEYTVKHDGVRVDERALFALVDVQLPG